MTRQFGNPEVKNRLQYPYWRYFDWYAHTIKTLRENLIFEHYGNNPHLV